MKYSASQPASRGQCTNGVTKPAIEHLLRDVNAELVLLNRLSYEVTWHPVGLNPEQLFSAATLAKANLSAMGVTPPLNISDEMLGIGEQALFAGRAEATIRRTPLPVTYCDFHAQFPAVSSLLNCQELLCAQSLEFADFTDGAIRMLKQVTLDDCFRRGLWKKLPWFALVEPCGDVVPMRAKFGQA